MGSVTNLEDLLQDVAPRDRLDLMLEILERVRAIVRERDRRDPQCPRLDREWTQEEIAEFCGIHRSYVHLIEQRAMRKSRWAAPPSQERRVKALLQGDVDLTVETLMEG